MLDPKVASDVNQWPVTITSLAAHFPSVVAEHELNELDDHGRSFGLSANKVTIATESIPKYWYILRNIKNGMNNSNFLCCHPL